MMKDLILGICGLIAPSAIILCQIPSTSWIKTYGGSRWEQLEAVVESHNANNIICVGSTISEDGDVIGYHGPY